MPSPSPNPSISFSLQVSLCLLKHSLSLQIMNKHEWQSSVMQASDGGVNQSTFHSSLIFIRGLESSPQHLDLEPDRGEDSLQVNIYETAGRSKTHLQGSGGGSPVCQDVCFSFCVRSMQTKGQRVTWVFQSGPYLADQYRIVLGNKHQASHL